VARQSKCERIVPRFVERELRAFLECGVWERGFRFTATTVVRTGWYPSPAKAAASAIHAAAGRMADTAAHLVDRVFPEVPIRQWVLSLPFSLRYRLADDARLVRDVLHILLRAISGSLRRRRFSGYCGFLHEV
jgi:hypothetical protein